MPNMDGDTGSELHRFGTDRLTVNWPLTASPPRSEPPFESMASLPGFRLPGDLSPSAREEIAG